MAIRILLADDQTLLREGIKVILGAEQGIEVVGEAANSDDVVERAIALVPDVLLMDAVLPDGEGITAIRTVRARCQRTQVLVLTSHPDVELFRKAATAGAIGYILKDISPGHLVNAIRAVCNGSTMLSPIIARRIVEEYYASARLAESGSNGEASVHGYGLTQREIEVLACVARGLSDKVIATNLSLSESTVKTRLRTIYQKLKLRNRAQAAVFAAGKGLLGGFPAPLPSS